MADYRKYQKEDTERQSKSKDASKNTTYSPFISLDRSSQKSENDAYNSIRNIHDSMAEDAGISAKKNSDKAERPPMSRKWTEK